MVTVRRLIGALLLAALALAGCAPTLTAQRPTPTAASSPTTATTVCNGSGSRQFGYSPEELRAAYGVTSLYQRGYTGKGQTVVVIDSFGSPTLAQDLASYSAAYCLPAPTLQVLTPLGTTPFDPTNKDMAGWAGETTLDVEVIHAVAPDAAIVVLTSPISETEGVQGLPEFRQLEEYAVQHHLGNVISQSWGASEVTLTDAAGQAEIAKWTDFYKTATTQQGITFTTGSGDNGATDYRDLNATQLSPTPTTSFPSDEPWVLSAGGTSLSGSGAATSAYSERAWQDSGGGFSRFFAEPDFQKALPATDQSELQGRRGVPDIASDADPNTGMAIYSTFGGWNLGGGTSAAAPLWAALIAIADQMAGHPLGYITPTLYKLAGTGAYPADFRDVTTGNNGQRTGGVNITGYDAAPGWDPVTGLGTPLAEKLLPALIAARAS